MSAVDTHDISTVMFSCLSLAEQGDISSQDRLCRFFFDHPETVDSMPDAFWERIERVAQQDEDYANFIMHYRYFTDHERGSLSYSYIRKAIRHAQVPLAFLRLGVTYKMGVGTRRNPVLAAYLYEKALSMGCEEAEDYLDEAYESGAKNIVTDISNAMKDGEPLLPATMSRFRKRVERERVKKNFGNLSGLRDQLPQLYPEYSEEKGIDDLVNQRDTTDADIYYAIHTYGNNDEIELDVQESMLRQLFAPVTQDEDLLRRIQDSHDTHLLTSDEQELVTCLGNFTTSYNKICNTNGLWAGNLITPDTLHLFPYINIPSLALLRRQALSCLLSLRSIVPIIEEEYLPNLYSQETLLNICEKVRNQDLQLFLISFVEMNIDTDTLEINSLKLLRDFQNGEKAPLAQLLNEFVDRLTSAGIAHNLLSFTPDDLPPIEGLDNVYH